MGLVIQDSTVSFDDSTLPVIQGDAVLNAGSNMLFDVLDPVSNPHLPKGANFPGGSWLANLVLGGGNAIVEGGVLVNGVNGIYFGGAIRAGLNFGPGWDHYKTKWIKLIWYRLDAGFSGAVPQALWHRSNGNFAPGDFQSGFIMEGDGDDAAAWIASPTATARFQFGPAALGSVTQLGMAYDPTTGILQGIRNGEIIGEVRLPGGGNLSRPVSVLETSGYGFGGLFKGTIYHYYAEDLNLSGQSVADVAMLDYLCNVGRFT